MALAAKTPAAKHLEAGDERRHSILAFLQEHRSPARGSELAKKFRVSRQCLVQDIAILRASGSKIVATPRGYHLPEIVPRAYRETLACKHPPGRTAEELTILVDHGVKILDVIVEHPIYGEIRGPLMLESRSDVEDFLKQVRARKATLLSALTSGVHLHTVEAHRPEQIARAKSRLSERGFLLR
jgi:transcriptional regulator of NAD metabolism